MIDLLTDTKSLLSHVALHETIGVFFLLTGCVSWLMTWFLVRHEHLSTGSWRPERRSVGWALAGKLFWEGVLDITLGLLVVFSRNELPWYGIVISIGLLASSIVLFKAYSEVGKA